MTYSLRVHRIIDDAVDEARVKLQNALWMQEKQIRLAFLAGWISISDVEPTPIFDSVCYELADWETWEGRSKPGPQAPQF